jgi:hypothetical protein
MDAHSAPWGEPAQAHDSGLSGWHHAYRAIGKDLHVTTPVVQEEEGEDVSEVSRRQRQGHHPNPGLEAPEPLPGPSLKALAAPSAWDEQPVSCVQGAELHSR